MRVPLDQPYRITNPFGVPDSAAAFGKHAGIDYGVPTGRNVYAPVSGIVTDYTWGKFHGSVVQIFDGTHYHRLMHNSKLLVTPGQPVKEGDLVAKSGATGIGISGPHLHWDVASQKIPTSFMAFVDPNSLGKEDVMPEEGEIHNAFLKANGRKATPQELAIYKSKPYTAPDGLLNGKVFVDLVNFKEASQGEFKPYDGQQLFVKK